MHRICRENYLEIFSKLLPRLYSESKFFETPVKSSIDTEKLPPPTRIDNKTIEHLERLSLVDFGDERGIKIVEDAIRFADRLSVVDTTNVEPLVSVLEDQTLYLREDKIVNENTREDILSHAQVTEEEYYLAPVGNIDLKPLGSVKVEESKPKDISDLQGARQNC